MDIIIGLISLSLAASSVTGLVKFIQELIRNKSKEKEIEIEIENNGHKIKIKASSKEELESAIQAAQEFLDS